MTQVETPNRATSDPQTRKDVLKRIDDEGVEFVLLWFTDLEGHLKSFAVTPSEIEGALDDGMGFDGSSITGFNAIEESDMVAIPDPDTYQLMPWREGETKVGRMICDIVTPDGNPYEATRGTCCGARSTGCTRWASTRSTLARSSSTSSSRTTAAPRRSTRAATSR